MRFRSLSLVLAISVVGCGDQREPVLDSDDIALLRESAPGIKDECVELVRFEGIEAFPTDVDECFSMSDRQEFRGVWVNRFEGSTFCPDATHYCEATLDGPNIWLSVAEDVELPVETASGPEPRYFALVFDGRITTEEGFHGRGASDHEVVVENLISEREIRPKQNIEP